LFKVKTVERVLPIVTPSPPKGAQLFSAYPDYQIKPNMLEKVVRVIILGPVEGIEPNKM